MARPVVSAFAEELYDGLGLLTSDDESFGWTLLLFCDGIAQMFLEVEELVRDTDAGAGWSSLLDIDRVPSKDLGFLGQFVGVSLLVGLSDVSQRQRIRETSGQHRGTPDAIKGAARQFLTGTKRVDLFERDGSPYVLRVRTFSSETPDTDAVYQALLAEKPAALVLVYDVVEGMSYADLDAFFTDYADMTASGDTYADLTAGIP